MEERNFAFHDDYSRGEGDYHGWSDSDLVAICREGNLDAYEPLIRRYANDVYRMTYALVGNAEDAYDVTEQAFVSGFPEVRRLKPSAPFSIFVFRAAIEGCRRLLRGDGLYTSPEAKFGLDIDPRSEGIQLPGGYCSIGARRARQSIEAVLACLPAAERFMFVLRDIVGFSVEQAARVLQWPVAKARVRLADARQMICRGLHPETELGEPKRCQKSEEFLSDYMEGQLHPRLYDQMADHIRECRECAEDLKKMEEVLSQVAQAVNYKPPGDVWKGVSIRLAAGEIERPQSTPLRRRGILWRIIALITLFLSLVLGGEKLINHGQPSGPRNQIVAKQMPHAPASVGVTGKR